MTQQAEVILGLVRDGAQAGAIVDLGVGSSVAEVEFIIEQLKQAGYL